MIYRRHNKYILDFKVGTRAFFSPATTNKNLSCLEAASEDMAYGREVKGSGISAVNLEKN